MVENKEISEKGGNEKVSVETLKGILEDVTKARYYIKDIINTPYLYSIDYPVTYLLDTVYNNLVSIEYILELEIDRELSKKENIGNNSR